jgi:hypothetical protein
MVAFEAVGGLLTHLSVFLDVRLHPRLLSKADSSVYFAHHHAEPHVESQRLRVDYIPFSFLQMRDQFLARC